MYDRIVELNKSCNTENLIKFYQVHIYQGALEAVLSFYLVQILLIMTTHFSKAILSDTELYNFVIVSLMSCTVIFIIYIVVILIIFTWNIYNSKGENNYEKVRKKIQNVALVIHLIGAISYGIIAYVTKCIFEKVAEAKPEAGWLIMGAGIGLGIIWNMQDFCADNRLNLSAIFLKLKDKRDPKEEKKIFHYTFIHAIFSLGTLVGIIGYVIGLMFSLYEDSEYAKRFISKDFIKDAYVLMFFAICILYAKTVFALYYKKKGQSIYLYIADFKQELNDSDVDNDSAMHMGDSDKEKMKTGWQVFGDSKKQLD